VDIGAWLGSLGLDRYEAAFRDNDVDLEVLPRLTADDLRELGVNSVGHRRRLLTAIAGLGVAPAEPVAAPARLDEGASLAAPNRAERRQLTVMFVDLVGSTALANRLDPEEMRDVLRVYQDACTGAVARFEGHVAKFMGDGVLAYFGYPCAHEDDAERAVCAGLEVVRAVGALAPRPDLRLQVRVGIATGMVVVGDLIGEGAAQEEVVVGETPNLAARLQGLAELGGVVIGPTTRQLVGGRFRYADLGPHRLKGFTEPVRAWGVIEASQHGDRFEARQTGRVTPLIGREHELGLLLDRWRQAREGEGQVVLLCGEPGLGKSRLVQALRERLQQEPHTPVSHFCSPYHQSSALYPIIGLLERAAGFSGDDLPERQLEKLEALVGLAGENAAEAAPLLAELLAIPTAGRYPALALSPQRQKERTMAALLGQLAGLAGRQPVLALYEDVHWADPTTLELLDLVVDRVQDLPVLAIVTFRPEFRPPWIGAAHVTLVTFNRLSRRHTSAMVERLTGGKSLPPQVLEQIVARTDGVPLFVEELTKTVLGSGLLHDTGDRYTLAGPLPALAIPATLQDSLMARLDRLAPAREVAQVGAVIGREFSFELVAALVPLAEPELMGALARLVADGLVFQRGSPPDATYVFKHALVQDAAYESLLRSRRQVLHARTAQALESQFSELVRGQPETVAHHWANAGIPVRAAEYWTAAGQLALARSATTEALTHFRAALAEVAKLPESAERDERELAVQRATGSAMVAAHGFAAPETGQAYARALELTERLGDFGEMFPVLYGLCLYRLYRAELAAARAAAERLVGLAATGSDTGFLFFAHRAAGVSALPSGDFTGARQHLQCALSLYQSAEHRRPAFVYAFDPRVVCLDYLARTLLPLGEIQQAVQLSDEALDEARRLSHRNSLCLPLFYGAVLHQQLGEADRVAGLVAELEQIAREERFPIWAAGARILQGWLAANAGRPGVGGELIVGGICDWQATGARLMEPYFRSLLAEAKAAEGHLDQAADLLCGAIEQTDATGELWYAAELHRGLAETLRVQGDVAGACAELRAALEIATRQCASLWRLRSALALGICLADAGEGERAVALLEPLLADADACRGAADRVEAMRLLTRLGGTRFAQPPPHEPAGTRRLTACASRSPAGAASTLSPVRSGQ
jgi:class 3 adenylate cyclase/predicted ATPase